MSNMKKLLILGASGSIGKQTIDLLLSNLIDYDLVGFSVGHKTENIEVLQRFFKNIKHIYMISDDKKKEFEAKYPNINFYSEADGFEKFILNSNPDLVVNALVGFAGVIPSIVTIKNNIDLALANKESLVVAGDLIKELLKTSKSKLIPIDSEHVALDKCLKNVKKEQVDKLILTCSGGPFRTKNIEELQGISKNEALNHPTWKMGNKITIDSATLINKVFEIIEAHYLFDYNFEDIKVVIHPQSKVHSGLLLKDKEFIFDYGPSDMRNPIYYALSYKDPNDVYFSNDLKNIKELQSFYEPNDFQNSVLSIAKVVLDKKGNTGAILNSANDLLVEKFLNDEIEFLDIYKYINLCLKNINYISNPNLSDIIYTNNIVKYYLLDLLKGDK